MRVDDDTSPAVEQAPKQQHTSHVSGGKGCGLSEEREHLRGNRFATSLGVDEFMSPLRHRIDVVHDRRGRAAGETFSDMNDRRQTESEHGSS